MKSKPPYQLLVLDDDGVELLNVYVSRYDEPGAFDVTKLEGHKRLHHLGAEIILATTKPINKKHPKWICP